MKDTAYTPRPGNLLLYYSPDMPRQILVLRPSDKHKHRFECVMVYPDGGHVTIHIARSSLVNDVRQHFVEIIRSDRSVISG